MEGFFQPAQVLLVLVVLLIWALLRFRRSGARGGWLRGLSPRVKMFACGALLDEAYFSASLLLITSSSRFYFGDLQTHLMTALRGGLSALVLYELIWRTRAHLYSTTFPVYVLGVWYVQGPLASGLYLLTTALRGGVPDRLRVYFSDPVHWLKPQLSFPYVIFDVLSALVVVTLAYYFIFGTIPRRVGNKIVASAISYGGTTMSKDETTRQLCASAWTSGRGFRKKVLEHFEDKHRAVAPEAGVDIDLVTQVCNFAENREKRYDWFFLLIGLAALVVALAIDPTLGAVVAVLASAALYLRKFFQEQGILGRHFQRGKFEASAVRGKLTAPLEPDLERGLPTPDQNLIIYQGFTPFIGAGTNLGGWSFTVDTNKPREQGLERGPQPQPLRFASDELYAAIDQGIGSIGLDRLNVRDFWFVNGSEIREDRNILPHIHGRPVQRVDPASAASYRKSSDSRVRHYQWMSINDWGNDLVMSFFLRCALRGSSLFVEINRYLLTPLTPACHAIDNWAPPDGKKKVAIAVGAAIVGPISIILSAFSILGRFNNLGERWFDTKEQNRLREIDNNPLYNYGAQTSIRQTYSGTYFGHYFQKMDGDFYTKVLEHEILDTIVTFLDEHDIDTSELRERRTLILNSGIIVQGGDVSAESLAVGAGATAVKSQSVPPPKKAGQKAKGASA